MTKDTASTGGGPGGAFTTPAHAATRDGATGSAFGESSHAEAVPLPVAMPWPRPAGRVAVHCPRLALFDLALGVMPSTRCPASPGVCTVRLPLPGWRRPSEGLVRPMGRAGYGPRWHARGCIGARPGPVPLRRRWWRGCVRAGAGPGVYGPPVHGGGGIVPAASEPVHSRRRSGGPFGPPAAWCTVPPGP